MSQVINIKQAPLGWRNTGNYAYIGRSGLGFEGYFGNPINHKDKCIICGVIHGLPGSTLLCYEKYLANRLEKDAWFKHRFYSELTGKILVCFCKPARCHGDIILRYLEAGSER